MTTIYLEKSQVPGHLRVGGAQRYEAEVCERVIVPSHAGLWDGGSRETYRVVRLSDGAEIPASDDMSAPCDASRRDREIVLEPGVAVVRRSVFCGKHMPLRFYVHPADAVALLPPVVELTGVERRVLSATRSYKASYNGRDRYSMARDAARWERDSDPFPTRQHWEEVKARLVERGYLNRAGAITVAGRNAIGRD